MLKINYYNWDAIKYDSLFLNFNVPRGLELHRALEMFSNSLISESPKLVKLRHDPEYEIRFPDSQASELTH